MLNKKIGIFDVVNVFALGLVAFLCAYPFYYLIIYSLSNSTEVARTDIWLLPAGFTLYNYEVLLRDPDIWHAFFISAARTVVGTILTVICSAFLAYLLTQKDKLLRHARILTRAFLPRNVSGTVLRICSTANKNLSGFFTGKDIACFFGYGARDLAALGFYQLACLIA